MNTGLLSGTDTDCLPVIGKANRVGLGIFQGNQRNHQIPLGTFRQGLVLGHDILQQLLVDLKIISLLFKGDTEDLLALHRLRGIRRVDLHNIVIALPLGLQDFKGFRGIARSDDAIRNLTLNQKGGLLVADIGQRDKVTEGAHPVGASCPGVGAGEGAVVQFGNVVHEARLFQVFRQHLSHGGGGGGDVLEGRHGDHAGGFLQFLHKLPGVEGVQKIDVAGAAVQDGDGQLGAVCHVDLRGLLVGVAAVFQFKFFHVPSLHAVLL